jgi:soluble lytic murein transglycosylase-like protein
MVALTLFGDAQLGANEAAKAKEMQLAALALPSTARADWQQWDSFFTFAVKRLAQELRPAQRDQMAEVFLDARYQLTEVVNSGASDPVPRLFLDSWERVSPILKQSLTSLPPQTASQFTGFIGSMDTLKNLANLGGQFGFFRITPDALRGAARFLGTGNGDPLAYTLDIDSALRTLLGFTEELPPARPSSAIEHGRLERLRDKAAASLRRLSVRSAHAAEDEFDRLNNWVPESRELPEYLLIVQKLFSETSDHVLAKSSLGAEHQKLYRQTVLATGWQESCWRQFVKKGDKLTPLASSTGDVGLMQVNRTTWRSLYDIKGLSGDMSYNGHAGAEILYQYLTRYAIGKGEDKQPGGHLARATYSAYNAGPGGLARYRGVRQSATWKKVDEAFWAKFKAVSAGQELAIKSCYGA